MQWSPEQDDALRKFTHWYKSDGRKNGGVFRLFGFAGTGKSTIAKELASQADGRVTYAAFTGKAASVMRKKGCVGASTIHSLIYNTARASRKALVELEVAYGETKDPDERERLAKLITEARAAAAQPKFRLNPYSAVRDAALVVVDEVSMVSAQLGQDLLSFNRPILVLGDPAQLPPVKGAGFFTAQEPDAMLTEVHRFALESPITRIATLARQGEPIPWGDYGGGAVCVVDRAALRPEEAVEADQVLVGRNRSRTEANRKMRNRLGFPGAMPNVGEKVVCLRNNHDLGLLNGTLHRVAAVEDTGADLLMDVVPEDEESAEPIQVMAYREPFNGEDAPRWGADGMDEFTFGYALTTHKAQGSEWPSVLVLDESSAFRGDAHRWLYTAVTRASEKLTLVI